ncbi:MAG: thioredoxin family protein [Bacteroidota bacterium]|nr:thioredoxin family protein [Bacteroidota bacterium]
MMKRIILLFLLAVLLSPAAAAQDAAPLLGPLTIEDLLDLPEWFGEDFIGYLPDPQYADQLETALADVEMVCVLGTWCSDSKREVPRMLRIMQYANIPPEKLRMIGVDREKQSPGGEAAPYQVTLVPTFIFLRDGKEIGRIVEAPLATLEKDILGIVLKTGPEGTE